MDLKHYRGMHLLGSFFQNNNKNSPGRIKRNNISDVQQGFRTGRSCIDAVFIVKQLTEKSLEFNK